MIASDHGDLHARFAAAANRRWHFGTWRILETHETGDDQILLRIAKHVCRRQHPVGEGEYPQPAVRHRGRGRGEGAAPFRGQPGRLSVELDPSGTRQQFFGRALGEEHNRVSGPMNRGHPLALGLERNLVDAFPVHWSAERVSRHPCQRLLHRIANPLPRSIAAAPQVMTTRGALEETCMCLHQ